MGLVDENHKPRGFISQFFLVPEIVIKGAKTEVGGNMYGEEKLLITSSLISLISERVRKS